MKPLVVANWKMHTTLADATVLATLLRNQLHQVEGVDVVLCPPMIWLQEVASILEVSAPHLYLGAQNCYPAEQGAFTGEVSITMLKDLCQFVLVGHSERREYFNESSEFISDKVQAALQYGLTPILCVGEQHKAEGSIKKVLHELLASIEGIKETEYPKLVIAYEPVWAISAKNTGMIADGAYANQVTTEIKEIVGKETRVVYGGSVDARNVEEFISQPAIDGVLVGSASLKATEFVGVCKKAQGQTS